MSTSTTLADQVLTAILGETPEDVFSVSKINGLTKISVPIHVSLEGLKTLPEEVQDMLQIDVGNDYTVIRLME